MFERLKYLYSQGLLTIQQLDLAITKGWITEEQKLDIVG